MIDMTELVVAILGILGAVITTFYIPYLKQKLNSEQFSQLKLIINVAVEAAEMLYKGSNRGPEKKEYVIKCINEFLATHKLKVDFSIIENMIESAVLELKDKTSK